MAIQSHEALVLDALSILNDVPPHPKQPVLKTGTHLCWFPGEKRAFPLKGGYYLFRRRVDGTATPICLMPLLRESNALEIAKKSVWPTAIGTLIGFEGALLKPLPIVTSKLGVLGFIIDQQGVQFRLPTGVTASSFTVRLRFLAAPISPKVQVSASFGSTVLFNQSVSPPAPPQQEVTLNANPTRPVDTIRIWGTSAILLDLCYVPVSSGKDAPRVVAGAVPAATAPSLAPSLPGQGWELIPNLTSVITLPLVHPSYPASAGAESINAARAIANSRFHYGNWPDYFQSAARTSGPGTVTLTNGSAIVTGSGSTNWTADLVGKLICVPKGGVDYTAYAVMSVLSPNRAVLSRPYSGPSQSNAAYDLVEGDDFAELHDRIACLLHSPNDMRAATAPPILDQGTVATGKYVRVFGAVPVIQGIGTQWNAGLTGCYIEIGPTWSNGAYFAGSNIYRIQSVNSASQITLDRNFAGPPSLIPGTKGNYRIVARAGGDSQDANSPAFEFKPMDLLELACLMPSYAQAIGLYWIDPAVVAEDVFDYIVIADHSDRFSHQAANALTWLNGTSDFSGDAVDGYVVTGLRHSGTPALPPPSQMELFRLPCGGARISIEHPDRADSDAGVCVKDAAAWKNAGPGQRVPVMINLWRQARGTDATNLLSVGNLSAYQDLGKVLPSRRDPNPDLKLPAGWPPNPPSPIHFVDSDSDGTGLDVGWYSYRANTIDIFGRWSPTSAPIPWTVSGPPPPVGDAVHLEDTTPPPPPAGVLAWILDDKDPYLLRDPAYDAWKAAFGTSPLPVGLRIQWRWPWPHQNQGPDLSEFRIYFQSKPLNARTGRVTSVAPDTGEPTQSLVTLDLGAPDASQDDYTDASLQAGNRSFPIKAGHGGANVQLTVKNGGPLHDEPPESNVDGAIVIPTGHPLHKELLNPGNWTWLAAAPQSLPGTRYEVEMVEDPAVKTFDADDNTFSGAQATWNGSAFVLDAIPPGHNLAAVRPGIDVLALASDEPAYFVLGIQSVQTSSLQIVPLQPPALIAGTKYQWRLGPPTPGLQGIAGKWNVAARRLLLDGNPNLSNVHVGTDLIYVATAGATPADLNFFLTIEAVDAVNHTVTLNGTPAQLSALAVGAPTASLTWQIGRPVRYYEVFLPDPRFPAVALAPNLNTSALLRPDLAQPVAYGAVGVSSADWRKEVADQYPPPRARYGNESFLAGPATVFEVLRDAPPAPPSYNWTVSRLYATKANYQDESFFTMRWDKPATGPYFAHVLRAMDHSLFLTHWNATPPISIPVGTAPPTIQAFVLSFDAHKTSNDYAAASALYDRLDDASLAWLAALPDFADAYAQVTINPLNLSDPANQDRLGPDDPKTFIAHPTTVCAYTDKLPGKSTNRYFYRVMLLDGAQNRGPLGVPSPPVYLPKVVPPRAPVIIKVLGGDRQITIRWAANREADLAEYRVYRTDDERKAEDVRLMDLVETVTETQPNPVARPKEVVWTDSDLAEVQTFYYRAIALDDAGNRSGASAVVRGRAYRESLPDPPVWVSSVRQDVGGNSIVRLIWTLGESLEVLIQRRSQSSSRWSTLGNWLPIGTTSFDDNRADPSEQYAYRLLGRDFGGKQSGFGDTVDVPPV